MKTLTVPNPDAIQQRIDACEAELKTSSTGATRWMTATFLRKFPRMVGSLRRSGWLGGSEQRKAIRSRARSQVEGDRSTERSRPRLNRPGIPCR